MSYKKKSQNERYEEELAKAHERLYPRKKRLAHNGSGSYSDGSLQGVNIFDQQNLVQDFGELLGVQNLDFEKPLSKSRSDHKAKQTRNFPLLQKSQKHLKYIRHNVCSASKQRAHVATSIPEKSKSRSKKERQPDSESQYDCQDESCDGFYRHGIAENVKNRGRLCKPATDAISPKDCDFGEQLCKHDEKNNFKLKEIIDERDRKEQRNKLKFFHNKSKEDRKHKHRRKLERYEESKKVKHNVREHSKSSKIKKKRETLTCSINIHACREISCMLEYNSKVKGKLTDLTINLTSLSVKSISSHEISPVSNSLNSEPVNDLEMHHLIQNSEIPVPKENALISTKPDSLLGNFDSSPLEINAIEDMSDDDITVLEESSKFNVQISQICSTPNWEIKKEMPDDNSSCDMNAEKSSVAEKDEVIELSDDDEIEILEVKASESKSILNNEKVESSNSSVSISAQSTLQQVIDNVKISSDSMTTIEGVDKSISKLLNNLSENTVPSLSELCPVTVQSLPCKKKPDKNNSTLSLNQFTRPECKVKYDEIEDELDSNTISNILSLNPDKESTISPLIELFERESKDLQTIQYAVRNYSNVAAGLKMLEKEKLKRLQSMTYALKKLEGSKPLDQRSNPIIQNSTSTFQSTMPVQQCINNILSKNVNEQFIKQTPVTEQCHISKFENCVSQNLLTSGSKSLGSTNYSPTQNLNKDSDISISKPNSRISRTESSSEDVEIVHFVKPPPPYHSSHTMPSSHSKQVFSTASHHEPPNNKCFESPTISHKKMSGSSQDFNKVSSVQGRFCQVCRKKAVFACQGCEKVFFCSNACGVSFWNDGHSAVC